MSSYIVIYIQYANIEMSSLIANVQIAENENISKMYKYIQCNTSKAFYFHAC